MNRYTTFPYVLLFFLSLQVQIDNDKIRRDRESRGSRIDLSGLCVSSNATTQSIATMRQQSEQRTQSSRVRNSNGLIIDSQGNSIPLSPVSSNTSSGSSDNMEQHKPVPMTPSGEFKQNFFIYFLFIARSKVQLIHQLIYYRVKRKLSQVWHKDIQLRSITCPINKQYD